MFDEILVPTDGSEHADIAVEYARDLGSRYEATIHVMSAVDPRTLDNAAHYEQVRDDRVTHVHSICETLSESDLSTREEVRSEIPYEAILAYADEQDIDLIVMGTHGRTGVERYLLGSVTEKVVRLSDIPVLTVGATDDGSVTYPYSDVLLPTDGSEGSIAASKYGIELASAYDACLHALSVVEPMFMGVDGRSDIPYKELEQSAQEAVETIEARAVEASVSAVTRVETGHPHREILSYIDDNAIDLVVMGTHGRSGLERYLLGSVTEKVIRTSPVPVMTVRMSNSPEE